MGSASELTLTREQIVVMAAGPGAVLSKTPRLAAPQRKVRDEHHLSIADMEAIAIFSLILAGLSHCAVTVLQHSILTISLACRMWTG